VYLSRIQVFPIKSLEGICPPAAALTAAGPLERDRAYALFDADGKKVNGKRHPRIHGLRCSFDDAVREVEIWAEGAHQRARFVLAEPAALERWLGEYFGFAVELRHDPQAGFPDDRAAPGPTVVAQASLEAVAAWFPGLSLESVRRRFRANLEIGGAPAFAEDVLYGGPEEFRPFAIGGAELEGCNPCQRCAVPTRDPWSGAVLPDFQRAFSAERERLLPPWAEARRFNHFYRFAVNTRVPPGQAGAILRVGDPVRLAFPAPAFG
jgi:uncharacterized protein YcbX